MCLGKVHRGQGAESASRGWNNVGLCGRNLVPFFSFGDHAGFITENIVPFLSENAQKRFWAPPPYQLSEHAVIDNKKKISGILQSFSWFLGRESAAPIFFSIREWLFEEIILIAALNKLNLKLN